MGRPGFNTAQKPSQRTVEEGTATDDTTTNQQDEEQPSQIQQPSAAAAAAARLQREIVYRHQARVKARLYLLTALLALAVLTTGYLLSTCIPVFYNIFVEERVDIYAPENDTSVDDAYTQMHNEALQHLFEYRAQLEAELNNEKYLRRIAERENQHLREQNGILVTRLRIIIRPEDIQEFITEEKTKPSTTTEVNETTMTDVDDDNIQPSTTSTEAPATPTAASREPSSVIWSADDLVQEAWSKKRPLTTEEFEKQIQEFLG